VRALFDETLTFICYVTRTVSYIAFSLWEFENFPLCNL